MRRPPPLVALHLPKDPPEGMVVYSSHAVDGSAKVYVDGVYIGELPSGVRGTLKWVPVPWYLRLFGAGKVRWQLELEKP